MSCKECNKAAKLEQVGTPTYHYRSNMRPRLVVGLKNCTQETNHLPKMVRIVLAVLLFPPMLFAAYISVQAGCFLCMEDELAGSWYEIVANLTLLLMGCAVAGAFFWNWFKGEI